MQRTHFCRQYQRSPTCRDSIILLIKVAVIATEIFRTQFLCCVQNNKLFIWIEIEGVLCCEYFGPTGFCLEMTFLWSLPTLIWQFITSFRSCMNRIKQTDKQTPRKTNKQTKQNIGKQNKLNKVNRGVFNNVTKIAWRDTE